MTFLRRYWKHLLAGHALLAGIIVVVLFAVGVFAGGALLTKQGQRIYKGIQQHHVEQGSRNVPSGEQLPPVLAAKVAAANKKLSRTVGRAHPLATPQPLSLTKLVRNFSSRNGARPILLVAHDTESPNVPGTQDVLAIWSWFNNVQSQASSNYTTDAEGNTILMVPDTAKAWTQAWFNPEAISDEMIGHASQTAWPETQLRAVAELFAAESKRWGIPIQLGAVSGCTITRAGIVDHLMLGACGGGHHDNGPAFPMAHFIVLVRQYAAPKVTPRPKPKPVVHRTAPALLKAKTGEWSWIAWRFGQAAWKGYGRANVATRPNVAKTIPAAWWRDAAKHKEA